MANWLSGLFQSRRPPQVRERRYVGGQPHVYYVDQQRRPVCEKYIPIEGNWQAIVQWSQHPQSIEEVLHRDRKRLETQVNGIVIPPATCYFSIYEAWQIGFHRNPAKLTHMPFVFSADGYRPDRLARFVWRQATDADIQPSDWYVLRPEGVKIDEDRYCLLGWCSDTIDEYTNEATGETLTIRVGEAGMAGVQVVKIRLNDEDGVLDAWLSYLSQQGAQQQAAMEADRQTHRAIEGLRGMLREEEWRRNYPFPPS